MDFISDNRNLVVIFFNSVFGSTHKNARRGRRAGRNCAPLLLKPVSSLVHVNKRNDTHYYNSIFPFLSSVFLILSDCPALCLPAFAHLAWINLIHNYNHPSYQQMQHTNQIRLKLAISVTCRSRMNHYHNMNAWPYEDFQVPLYLVCSDRSSTSLVTMILIDGGLLEKLFDRLLEQLDLLIWKVLLVGRSADCPSSESHVNLYTWPRAKSREEFFLYCWSN